MASRIKIDIEYLKQVYLQEQSILKVATIVGVSYGTVRDRLIKAGVELNTRGGQCLGEEKMTTTERVYKHRRSKKQTDLDLIHGCDPQMP